ncbi:phospholipase/carboxylesterase [Chitinophaga dinghuensis]|uniref:Phospholipase/carboxylesterase n=1 Tax=Chitinophaga dinghuensis TaxID=1539050 RepID=A0A327WD35_9BACT|nr:dienelactone hydrolase family protein [Chitinophaga dinghuensis]RAJ87822.1 phospholipase/carboxylesterase [Chitinophaga dinghuensis]
MRYLNILCCLLLSVFAIQTQAQKADSPFSYESYTRNGDTLRYRMMKPLHHDIHKKYPLIIFLHGVGERGNDNKAQLKHGGSWLGNDSLREAFPAYVIFPQLPVPETWAPMKVTYDSTTKKYAFDFPPDAPPTKPTALLKSLIDSLNATGNIDTKRVYIGGLSLGGMGTFYMITHYPQLFAAAFPICGGGDVNAAGNFAGKVPVWIFHGGADPIVPVTASRAYAEKLKSLGAEYKYTEYAGVEHNSWDKVFVQPGVLEWLFKHKK